MLFGPTGGLRWVLVGGGNGDVRGENVLEIRLVKRHVMCGLALWLPCLPVVGGGNGGQEIGEYCSCITYAS